MSLDSDSEIGETDVLAVSTESRDAGAEIFRQALDQTLRRLPPGTPRILFKKIDSTLRGNVGPEIASALAALACDVAVVTPAFPAMGRTVEAGYLRVPGRADFVPVELAACFHGHGAEPHRQTQPGAISQAIAAGARVVLLDAAEDSDLDLIVSEALALRRRVLWAGSAGLAAALARTMGAELPAAVAPCTGPAIFCLGSDHAATMEQQARLIAHRDAVLFAADSAVPEAIVGELQRGSHVVLRIRRGLTSTARIRQLLGVVASPLVLSGGDTAALVCHALDIRALDLCHEVAAGIPWGRVAGGPFDGLPVVTKSGGFGGPDALIDVADFFPCPQP